MDPSVTLDPAPVVETARRLALVEARLDAVRGVARARGLEAAVLTARRDTAWLTVGGELHVVLESEAAVAPIVVMPTRAVILAPINEATRIADEEIPELPFEIEVLPWDDPEAITAATRGLVGSRGLAGNDLEPAILPLRSRLDPLEHERMRWLGRRASEAIAAVDVLLAEAPAMTESDAVVALLAPLARAGVRAPVVLAAADERARRYRHPLPGQRMVRDRLLVVVVAERWGLHVAGTLVADRTARSERRRAGDEAVAEVLAAMIEATVPEMSLGEVLDAAIGAYRTAGFPDAWRAHHQGGTIGYQGRERIATPGDRARLEAGMAVAWNPSVPGSKAEATLLVTRDGPPEVLVPAWDPG